MGFFDFFRREQEVKIVTEIDSEIATRDSKIRALIKDNQSKTGELSRMKADVRKAEDKESEATEDLEKNENLTKQKNAIMSEKFEDALSLRALFRYMDKHPNYKISMMDRDMSTNFAEFYDLVIFKDGEMATLDKYKDIFSKGEKLKQIFFKPGSIKGQINKGLIRLPCDRNFIGNPDIEEEMLPECTYVDGIISWSAVNFKPLRQLIIDREQEIQSLNDYLRRIEESKQLLSKTNIELKRNLIIFESKIRNHEVEMSKMTNKYLSMDKKFRTVTSKLAQSQSMRSLAENKVKHFKEALDGLTKIVAEKLSKTDYDIFLAEVKDTVDWIDSKNAKPIPQQPQPTQPVKVT